MNQRQKMCQTVPNILTSYLTAEDSVDVESDDIDLSDFLAGYVGHSVIDALCSAVFLLTSRPESIVCRAVRIYKLQWYQ